MISRIREQVRLSISRYRDAGYSAIDVAALRRDVMESSASGEDVAEDTISEIIVEECSNQGIPVILKGTDLSVRT
ncbi:hypothetical protein GTW51_19180 [Aurantimonas aggregata]|uniref:Uncharacterized protein n=1 Tax=Aurantimonas aggregata TaxID=2047720 RepID=A0A6L9MM71_9HYPH|nr:hypothetical protein [Aurantimonas aggregata]NDV88821.1 hypothetical protein [Aurantimonas aggregata]